MIKHLGKGKRIRSALAIVLAASMLFSGNTLAFAAEDFEGSGEEIRQELSSAEDIFDLLDAKRELAIKKIKGSLSIGFYKAEY